MEILALAVCAGVLLCAGRLGGPRVMVLTVLIALPVTFIVAVSSCRPGWDSALCGWPWTWTDTSPNGRGWEWPGGFSPLAFLASFAVFCVPALAVAVAVDRLLRRRVAHRWTAVRTGGDR